MRSRITGKASISFGEMRPRCIGRRVSRPKMFASSKDASPST
jgi:hypothetical protein